MTTHWLDVDYVHREYHPFAIIRSKYRSMAALKSLSIIPRSPSPVPLEERPAEELIPAEMLELLNRCPDEQRQAKEADARKIKRECANSDGEDDGLTVVEERSTKRQLQLLAKGDIIVLD
ncbi:hypothetical protein EJ02DRAFT_426728 [Clathrospora elynae]|uniref:DUF7918 domain-containing protein n=1 Tax=Clathrospora elynae TaxID=706981 RepID=A0A6A5SBE7_9PLEO|nr:hypothetical protein EJ02DRAFT_426728 [Clathrospora elynae]